MSVATMEYTGRLVIRTCWCGIAFALPDSLNSQFVARKRHDIYCPLGHSMVPAAPSQAEIERDRERQLREAAERQVQYANSRRTAAEQALTRTEHSLRAQKAAKTRLKNRVKNGVCPCCNRSFVNLQQHMATQHPAFGGEA